MPLGDKGPDFKEQIKILIGSIENAQQRLESFDYWEQEKQKGSYCEETFVDEISVDLLRRNKFVMLIMFLWNLFQIMDEILDMKIRRYEDEIWYSSTHRD